MPSFSTRAPRQQEVMDDLSTGGAELESALDDLRWVNRWLGGHAAVERALKPLLTQKHRASAPVRLLDLGTGAADHPAHLVRWADRLGCPLQVTALDANPHAVRYARRDLRRRLPAYLRARVRVREGDALDLSFDDNHFDAALAALFMHHFDDEGATTLLQEMQRVSSSGLVVCDLHRHVLAYYGVRALGAVRPGTSAMFRHDGPLSVRRGYRRHELRALAERAGLPGCRIRWHWAFRWVLSTVLS